VFLDPLGAIQGLALVAMPVAAGVVADPAMPATVALLHMTTENRRAADLDGMHHPALQGADHAAIGFAVRRSMQTKNVRNLKRRFAHTPMPSRTPRSKVSCS
jgi:hypothetical protein